MIKVLGLKFWVIATVYIAISGGYIWSEVATLTGVDQHLPISRLAIFVWFVFALIMFKPIWRWVWKLPYIGSYFAKRVFPDLNGLWEVEMRSNWPIIDTLRNAAKDSSVDRFDVQNESTQLPDLFVSKFTAKIDQEWHRTDVRFVTNDLTPLKESNTLTVDLISEDEHRTKKIAWLFEQENRVVAPTDERFFIGAALLTVVNSDKIEGCYWNNRSWHKGLNAAGVITMKRIN